MSKPVSPVGTPLYDDDISGQLYKISEDINNLKKVSCSAAWLAVSKLKKKDIEKLRKTSSKSLNAITANCSHKKRMMSALSDKNTESDTFLNRTARISSTASGLAASVAPEVAAAMAGVAATAALADSAVSSKQTKALKKRRKTINPLNKDEDEDDDDSKSGGGHRKTKRRAYKKDRKQGKTIKRKTKTIKRKRKTTRRRTRKI